MTEMASLWRLGGLSWGELAKRVWNEVQEDNVFGRAAELSYYFLLALFPFLIFLTSIIGLVLGSGTGTRHMLFNYLARIMPPSAFQLIDNTGGVFYALTYLVLFAIPLFGMKALGVNSPWWLKLACASGFIVTLIYIRYSIVPITEVEDLGTFALKIIVTVLIANVVGVGLYVVRKQK